MFASQSAAQARAASRVTGLASALARGPCRNVPTTTTTMQLRTRRQKSFGAPSSGSCRRHESSPRPALELPAPLQTRPFSTTRQASIMTSPSSAAAAANGPGGSRARTVDMKVKQDAADQSLLAREDPAAAAATMRTMPTFSLEGKVCVVTGGARGLGLVMGNGVVQSGADLAIVDLNGASVCLSVADGDVGRMRMLGGGGGGRCLEDGDALLTRFCWHSGGGREAGQACRRGVHGGESCRHKVRCWIFISSFSPSSLLLKHHSLTTTAAPSPPP